MNDHLLVCGGAERLTMTLAQRLPDCMLCVAGRDKRAWPDEMLHGVATILFRTEVSIGRMRAVLA